jgi:hypothetical protein
MLDNWDFDYPDLDLTNGMFGSGFSYSNMSVDDVRRLAHVQVKTRH